MWDILGRRHKISEFQHQRKQKIWQSDRQRLNKSKDETRTKIYFQVSYIKNK